MNKTNISVSSSPSKIPYGGFSPVRLQTGRQRPPSRGWRGRRIKTSCRRQTNLYAVPVAVSAESGSQVCPGFRIGTYVQAALPPSYSNFPVQRPLARQRVMLSRQVNAYYGLIRVSGLLRPTYLLIRPVSVAQLLPTGKPEVPQFTLPVCTRVPLSVPRWMVRLLLTVTSAHPLAFAIFAVARHPLRHKNRLIVVSVTRQQVSLYATARRVCLPCPGQDFYSRAFIPGGRPPETSSITTRAYSQFPWPDFHRLDTQHYGLRAK